MFSSVDVLAFLQGRTMLDFLGVPSLFCFLSLFRLFRKNSDFALVLGAVGVGHSCPPYLGTRTQHVRGVGV